MPAATTKCCPVSMRAGSMAAAGGARCLRISAPGEEGRVEQYGAAAAAHAGGRPYGTASPGGRRAVPLSAVNAAQRLEVFFFLSRGALSLAAKICAAGRMGHGHTGCGALGGGALARGGET
jgi:hypothetical protein